MKLGSLQPFQNTCKLEGNISQPTELLSDLEKKAKTTPTTGNLLVNGMEKIVYRTLEHI